jgi:hypothetical protein
MILYQSVIELRNKKQDAHYIYRKRMPTTDNLSKLDRPWL